MTTFLQMVKDSIQTANEQIILDTQLQNSDDFNWWLIVALAELVLILILLIKVKKSKKERLLEDDGFDKLRKAKSQDIDMTNLMNSINSSRDLYKELSRKCHPDRFQDELIKNKADKIFQEISKNKRNYAKLVELKLVAKEQLNLKF